MDRTTEHPPLWTGSFIRICLANFFIFVNFHALLPTFPFFISHLGGDAVTIGLATALFSIASIVSRPLVGWLVDTRGRFTILVLGLVGMTRPLPHCTVEIIRTVLHNISQGRRR